MYCERAVLIMKFVFFLEVSRRLGTFFKQVNCPLICDSTCRFVVVFQDITMLDRAQCDEHSDTNKQIRVPNTSIYQRNVAFSPLDL